MSDWASKTIAPILVKGGIIDPTKVTLCALQNAVSVRTLLLLFVTPRSRQLGTLCECVGRNA
jgi:hypothetical protein